jgi:hypothetical protein
VYLVIKAQFGGSHNCFAWTYGLKIFTTEIAESAEKIRNMLFAAEMAEGFDRRE